MSVRSAAKKNEKHVRENNSRRKMSISGNMAAESGACTSGAKEKSYSLAARSQGFLGRDGGIDDDRGIDLKKICPFIVAI